MNSEVDYANLNCLHFRIVARHIFLSSFTLSFHNLLLSLLIFVFPFLSFTLFHSVMRSLHPFFSFYSLFRLNLFVSFTFFISISISITILISRCFLLYLSLSYLPTYFLIWYFQVHTVYVFHTHTPSFFTIRFIFTQSSTWSCCVLHYYM